MKSYTIQASFEHGGQVLDCSSPEILGVCAGAVYRSKKRAIEVAKAAQEAIDDAISSGDVDETTAVSVYRGRIQIWSGRD